MLYENNNSRSRSTINDESPPPNPQHKIALIIGITSQDGSYLTEILSTNGSSVGFGSAKCVGGWWVSIEVYLGPWNFHFGTCGSCKSCVVYVGVCDQASMVLSQIVFLHFLGNQTEGKK